jgi:hypothetical protein
MTVVLGRCVPEQMEILAFWATSLRSVAWIHAEVLLDSGGRPFLERQLARRLFQAGRRALQRRWILGVQRFGNEELGAYILPIVELPWWLAIAGAVLVVELVRRRIASARVNFLGECVFAAMTALTKPPHELKPTA